MRINDEATIQAVISALLALEPLERIAHDDPNFTIVCIDIADLEDLLYLHILGQSR